MIRQTEELNTIPFLLISDNNNPEERINAYRSGVDAFIDSNTSIREIYTLIETLIKRFPKISTPSQFSDYSLQGKLPHFTVVEILQMLNISKKSGTLTYFKHDKKERLDFGMVR